MAEETENVGKTIKVQCCGECPFVTPEPKCSESEFVEIDPEMMDDDIPAICPLMSGNAKAHGEDWVKLEDWILRRSPDNVED